MIVSVGLVGILASHFVGSGGEEFFNDRPKPPSYLIDMSDVAWYMYASVRLMDHCSFPIDLMFVQEFSEYVYDVQQRELGDMMSALRGEHPGTAFGIVDFGAQHFEDASVSDHLPSVRQIAALSQNAKEVVDNLNTEIQQHMTLNETRSGQLQDSHAATSHQKKRPQKALGALAEAAQTVPWSAAPDRSRLLVLVANASSFGDWFHISDLRSLLTNIYAGFVVTNPQTDSATSMWRSIAEHLGQSQAFVSVQQGPEFSLSEIVDHFVREMERLECTIAMKEIYN
eukprot:Gregarina_sp_Poly_1__5237@NODE_2777_length_1731_cov_666_754207_g452_i1_p1_GENE_NODE_2777_length_1731_cov_666_754207_g452_i1NODE_2777_length_1731_cov_666_754207_g452_i1_p1_ORF_typecomplete_len284_score38_38Gag_p24/PF00607_20/8_2e02Gag_p24/PF00607_20/0_058_NODE_2777_length_1731_cov_666_754207_g452_i11761027